MRSAPDPPRKGVLELHPTQQQWAGEVITVLREAAAAVADATTDERDQLDRQLLADLRLPPWCRSDGTGRSCCGEVMRQAR